MSPDPIGRLQRFRAKHNLPFVLLSDAEHRVAEEYGVWGEKNMAGKTHWGIIRSHFIIDEEGIVRDIQRDVSPEQSVARAVAAIQGEE